MRTILIIFSNEMDTGSAFLSKWKEEETADNSAQEL